MTQVWSLGVTAQQETLIFEPLEVGNKAGVGVHEICEGKYVREEEKRVKGPGLSGSTTPEYNDRIDGEETPEETTKT